VRLYSSSLGTFLSRDPAEEQAGNNLYAFVGNDAVNHADLLGMVIICCDDAESYFSELGLEKGKHYIERSKNDYVAKPGASFDPEGSIERLIVWRMLLARHAFKAKGLKVDGLRTNVRARMKIVERTRIANFNFGQGKLTAEQSKLLRDNPEQFFNSVNGTGLTLGCEAVTMIIFESANKWEHEEIRANDRVWIPGDWGFIRNRAWERDPIAWEPGSIYKGENVIHTGTVAGAEMFWGHFVNGIQPSKSEDAWFYDIKYRWKGGLGGDPKWKNAIKGPGIGLERNSETVPPDKD
jgi:hypothetical protein